jgi:putative DNA primase/helicase
MGYIELNRSISLGILLMSIDFDLINRYCLGSAKSLVPAWIPGGRFEGINYVVRNPTRPDKEAGSFKVNVTNGVWKDFAGSDDDSGGDLISLFAYIHPGMTQGDAAKHLEQYFGLSTSNNTCSVPLLPPPPPVGDDRAQASEWTPIIPIPHDAGDPPTTYSRKVDGVRLTYDITGRWEFTTATGEIAAYDVRFEKPDGKEVLPLCYCANIDGRRQWRFISMPKPRLLWNLYRLSQNPDQLVIGVEGCKKAKQLQEVFDEEKIPAVITTWSGGCQTVAHVDWSPLQGRTFVYWPDADQQKYRENHPKAGKVKPKYEQPGYQAAIAIASILRQLGTEIEIVDPPDGKPSGWDVGDAIEKEGWSGLRIRQFIEARKGPAPIKDGDDYQGTIKDAPFRTLGYDGDFHFYLPSGTRQVKAIKGESHSPSSLLTIAPLSYWRSKFRTDDGEIAWKMAADSTLRASEASGVYNPSRRRGRGAWWDDRRVVVHMGSYLLCDGAKKQISNFDSKYIYEAGLEISDDPFNPLPNEDSGKLLDICNSLIWDNPIHSYFLAGWCATAPICGAMYWRPHLWITGAAGTGKSWVLSNIIKPCLGPWALFVSSDSTSAGVRQALKSDARPVLHDEAEGHDEVAQKRLQSMLELARQSSSETGSKITKGSQSGAAQEFEIRSMFLFASIGVNIAQHADETRIIVASLTRRREMSSSTRAAHFEGLNNAVSETLTPAFCARLRARSIQMIPIIRENSLIFAKVVAERMGSRRTGDQIGSLLAGAFALRSEKIVTLEGARKWFDKHDWSEVEDTGTPDEQKLLDVIVQHRMRTSPARERSIGEMLENVKGLDSTDPFPPAGDVAEDDLALRRIGIRYDSREKMIWISDSHDGIRQILEETPWPKTWARLLRRLEGAQQKKDFRFLGTRTRATGLPWSTVMPDGE